MMILIKKLMQVIIVFLFKLSKLFTKFQIIFNINTLQLENHLFSSALHCVGLISYN